MRRSNSEGFALPIVIVTLLLMGIVAATTLVTAVDERRSARAMRQSVTAFYAAESGLQEVRATWSDSLARTIAPGDSADLGWRTLDNGAKYRAVLHRYDNGTQRIFALTVEGHGAGPVGGSRTLTYLMTDPRTPLHHNFQAAIVSIAGVEKEGNAGIISGHDAASSSDCASGGQPSIPAIVTPDSSLWQGGSAVTGPVSWLDGSVDFEWSGSPDNMAALIGIDWEAILNLSPDYDVQQPSDFPTETAYGTSWPVIFVADNDTLTGTQVPSGHGLIVAPEDINFGEGFGWDGLILVGDEATLIGNVRIRGGIVAGLDFLLGEAVDDSDIRPGTKDVQYHSCNVLQASAAATNGGYAGAGPRPMMPFTTRPFSEVLR